MATLFDVEKDLLEALEQMLEATGNDEIPEETQALVRGYVETAMAKRDRMAYFITASEQRADDIRSEAARLVQRAAALDNATARLKSYVVSIMEATGQRRLPGNVYTISVQKNPDSVEVTGDVPPEYQLPQKPAPPPGPDKRKIKAALEMGKQVPNSRIVTGAQRLVIK